MRLKLHCKYQETETLRFKINDPIQTPPASLLSTDMMQRVDNSSVKHNIIFTH